MHRDLVSLLCRWIPAGQIGSEIGTKGMPDEAIIPRLLLRVRRATLVTQDQAVYREHAPHPGYCLLVLPRHRSPMQLNRLARKVLASEGFQSVSLRMGKVARVTGNVVYSKEHQRAGEFSRQLP